MTVRLLFGIQILFAMAFCHAANNPITSSEIPFQFRDGLIWIAWMDGIKRHLFVTLRRDPAGCLGSQT